MFSFSCIGGGGLANAVSDKVIGARLGLNMFCVVITFNTKNYFNKMLLSIFIISFFEHNLVIEM